MSAYCRPCASRINNGGCSAESEFTDDMISRMEKALNELETQPANTEKYAGLDTSPATYSVVKKARDNDDDLHTNQTVSDFT